jgi:dual-specificity kinase
LAAVKDITRQVFEALAFMHTLELVHTDIKPENICLVSGDRRLGARSTSSPVNSTVRLIDFGTAEFCASGKQRHALVGTRQYRAPEVIFGSGWDFTLDVWAVACVVTEMLCGRQLFPAVGTRRVAAHARPSNSLISTANNELFKI